MTFHSDDLPEIIPPTAELNAVGPQGSESWLEWRKQGIGASDVPVILGVSPWKTAHQLWEEKVGIANHDQTSYATQRGQWLESKARSQYELLADCDMPPVLVVHPEYPYMRASLDGYNETLQRVLEIKCPGREDHQKALDGQIPEKYRAQVQFQMFVSGAKSAHYFSFDGESGCIVEVLPDLDYQRGLRDVVINFWEHYVAHKVAPELGERDFVHVTDEAALKDFARYRALDEQKKMLESELKELKETLVLKYSKIHTKVRCGGVELVRSKRKGEVDLLKIPQLQGVDLDSYRKASSESWTIRVK